MIPRTEGDTHDNECYKDSFIQIMTALTSIRAMIIPGTVDTNAKAGGVTATKSRTMNSIIAMSTLRTNLMILIVYFQKNTVRTRARPIPIKRPLLFIQDQNIRRESRTFAKTETPTGGLSHTIKSYPTAGVLIVCPSSVAVT